LRKTVMTPEEHERRIREIAERVARRLVEKWPKPGSHINELEDFAERAGQDLQRELSERTLQEEAERKEGNQTACACGGPARYQRHHGLTLVTAAGRVRVRRAYFHCEQCGIGHCPADTRLGLGTANTTPTAQARLAILAALTPYVQVADLVTQLGLPLRLDLKSTERVTQAVGTQLATRVLQPFGDAERPVAVGFDGVMIPTPSGNREARVGVVYEPNWNSGRTPAAEAELRKEYFATTESRESLVAAVCRRARERAAGAVVAVVSDGAALDWVDLEPHLPLRVEILDFYHVLERVTEIATALHSDDPVAATTWRLAMKEELLERGPRKLLKVLREWKPTAAAAVELRRVQFAYFERQEERLQYPEFLRRGFPIGSGAVEGACKHVVCDRFDGSGMRWQLATADPVLRLRAALLTEPLLDVRKYAATKPLRKRTPASPTAVVA
jgi:hypothetical protein